MKKAILFVCCILCLPLLFSCAADVGEAEEGPRETPAPTAAPLPALTPSLEGRFAGDWAGVESDFNAPPPVWRGLADALSHFGASADLLRFEKGEDGYTAWLGSADWRVEAYDETGFTLVCTRSSADYVYPGGGFEGRFDYVEGDSIRFSYEEDPAAPGRELLRGEASFRRDNYKRAFLFERVAREQGTYPCWYGGYEGMEGDFIAVAALGQNTRGRGYYAFLVKGPDGRETVLTRIEESGNQNMEARDPEFSDLTHPLLIGDTFWPSFYRYRSDLYGKEWEVVTAEHTGYFQTLYPARLNAEIEELRKQNDVWAQWGIMMRQSLLSYAKRLVRGELEPRLYDKVPDLVLLDPASRPAVSLAGIFPGDTLADAQELFSLHPMTEAEAVRFGYEGAGLGGKYTDGRGLMLTVEDDGRIDMVRLVEAGYETPDSRQVGDALDRSRLALYGKDAQLDIGNYWDADSGGGISSIVMWTMLDRVWDETMLDVDGDGEKERLTLSGRSWGSYLERGTVFYDEATMLAEPYDYGTKVYLRVYKGDAPAEEIILPLKTGYLCPHFCDKLQKNAPGKVWIVCPTGGTGNEEPIYLAVKTAGGWNTSFLGMIDIYS